VNVKPGKYLWCNGEFERLVWLGKPSEPVLWEEIWSKDDPNRLASTVGRDNSLLSAFKKYLPHADGNAWILEGGCGLGQWVVTLREVGINMLGLDYAEHTLGRVKVLWPDLPLVVGDVQHLPLADGQLAGYVSLGVAEHFVTGPDDILAECARLLRPGGMLAISVPYFNPLRRIKALVGKYGRWTEGYFPTDDFYQFAFAPREFCAILRKGGFEPICTMSISAMTGLRVEFPALYRLLKRGQTFAISQLSPSQRLSARQSNPKFMRGGSLCWAIQRFGLWMVHRSKPPAWFMGHMMLYIAAKKGDAGRV
jgi:SAM-dependent methyltransferase